MPNNRSWAQRFGGAVLAASEAGASQRDIARRARVSQPYIAQILSASKSRFVPRSRLGLLLVARRAQVIDIVRSHGAKRGRLRQRRAR